MLNIFAECTGLTSIEIPNSVTSIGGNAFYLCTNLSSIEIPNSVTDIGTSAFAGTTWFDNQPDGLVYAGKVAYKYKGTMPANTEIVLEDGTVGIAGASFSGCANLTSIEIPNSVITISGYAFHNCSGLTSIEIPNSVTTIGDCVFESCTGLTSVTIPNSVTTIGVAVFEDCTGLTSVTIPNSVTKIGKCMFYACIGLTSVTIPNSVTTIGGYAFYGCTNLSSIEIPNSVTDIGQSAFAVTAWFDNQPDGLVYAGKVAYRYKGTMPANTEIVLEDGTLGIAELAFNPEYIKSNKKSLTSVIIPNSVVSIGYRAFENCRGLLSVVIGNGVTYISKEAFQNCRAMKSLTLGRSLAFIDNRAFYACISLNTIFCLADNPPTCRTNDFYQVDDSKCRLWVHKESVAAYQSTEPWKHFSNIGTFIDIDETNFPDENFRNYLLSQDYGSDGFITDEEAAAITSINVANQGIESLKGIEHFPALTELICYDNQLTELDLSNSAIVALGCENNQLTSLNLSGCTSLGLLDCSDNQLTTLDLSGCAPLETLDCSNNQLTTLDISGCTSLTTVFCYGNQIKDENMSEFVQNLPDYSTQTGITAELYVIYDESEGNVMTIEEVTVAKEKGWIPFYYDGTEWLEYGGSTGIEGLKNSGTEGLTYYDLQGRRVTQPTKGVYIQNGKKVLVK